MRILMMMMVCVFVVGCRGDRPDAIEKSIGTIRYEVITVEGMPCIKARRSFESMALTCDWSKYKVER